MDTMEAADLSDASVVDRMANWQGVYKPGFVFVWSSL
jgi:hypothetical protein